MAAMVGALTTKLSTTLLHPAKISPVPYYCAGSNVPATNLSSNVSVKNFGNYEVGRPVEGSVVVGAQLLLRLRGRCDYPRDCVAASGDGETSTTGGGGAPVSEGSEDGDERVGELQEREEGGGVVGGGARRKGRGEARIADSTDWISSGLTRRFGLGAGLAWVGVLAFGVISEQIKTRTEVFREEQGTRDVEGSKEVALSNGIRYIELREGGGTSPQKGDLVLIDLTGKLVSTGETFVDTTAKGKRSVAFVFGAKPYSGGMCDGLEYVLRSMKVGGKRQVIVPPAFGFGETGATLNSGVKIPGNATLEYVVQLQRSSIAPS